MEIETARGHDAWLLGERYTPVTVSLEYQGKHAFVGLLCLNHLLDGAHHLLLVDKAYQE